MKLHFFLSVFLFYGLSAHGEPNVLGEFIIKVWRGSCSHSLSLEYPTPGREFSERGKIQYLGNNTGVAPENIQIRFRALNSDYKGLLNDIRTGLEGLLRKSDKPVLSLIVYNGPVTSPGLVDVHFVANGSAGSEERFSLITSPREWGSYMNGAPMVFESSEEDSHSIAHPYLLQIYDFIDKFQGQFNNQGNAETALGIRIFGQPVVEGDDPYGGLYYLNVKPAGVIELIKNELSIEFRFQVLGVGRGFKKKPTYDQRENRRRLSG